MIGERRIRVLMRWATWCVACLAALRAQEAIADRYEATASIRPIGALGRIAEDVGGREGGSVAVMRYGGGAELGVAYGLRNWLDIDGGLLGAGFSQAMYDPATVTITGSTAMGRLVRSTRVVQLRAGATFRLGVAWVPSLHLGIGIGSRMRTNATLVDDEHDGAFNVTPDGMGANAAFDFVALARLGFEHRLGARWSVGAHVETARAVGFNTPALDMFSAGLSLGYTWYPTWF
jgi:hypothetical protein